MQSSIFSKSGISGLQPLGMLEYCSSISHVEADHSLQQPQVLVACTIPLVWLLEEPGKVYWYAVLKLPGLSPPLYDTRDTRRIAK